MKTIMKLITGTIVMVCLLPFIAAGFTFIVGAIDIRNFLITK